MKRWWCVCGRVGPDALAAGGRMLSPVVGLLRPADVVVVIGAAVATKAAGVGHRRVAERLGRPAGTVQRWLRRFGSRAGSVRVVFTALLCGLDADPPVLEAAGSELADAVAARPGRWCCFVEWGSWGSGY